MTATTPTKTTTTVITLDKAMANPSSPMAIKEAIKEVIKEAISKVIKDLLDLNFVFV